MDGKLDRKTFAAIHDLKNDAVRLSRHIDRLEVVHRERCPIKIP